MRCAFVVTPLFVVAVLADPLAAQCPTSWTPGNPLPGFNGTVSAMASFDPTGNGAAVRIAVAGLFTLVGATFATNVAVFDAASGSWQALGSGLSGTVLSLAYLPNGDLIAGGALSSAGGVSVGNLARWNGSTWSSIGNPNGIVAKLTVMPNGDLVAGGTFVHIGGVPANHLARWNGTTWSDVGGGVADVTALQGLPNGDLVVAGNFETAGSSAASGIARWNGTTWSPLGLGLGQAGQPRALCLAVAPNGDLIAGGLMTSAGGAPVSRIAAWNGATWSPLGSGLDLTVNAVCVLANGDVVAAGIFTTAGGVPAQSIARWNGQTWSSMGSRFGVAFALISLPVSGTLVVASGSRQTQVAYTTVSSWSGTAWNPLTGTGDVAAVAAITTRGNRMTIAGTLFRVAGTPVNHVAEWDGSSWNNLGGGTNGQVLAAAYLPNGDLVIGGWFSFAGASAARNIARWDGSTWHAFGLGANHVVKVLAVSPTGELFAAGDFTSIDGVPVNFMARSDGVGWSALGNGNWSVRDIAFAANGDLIAVGNLQLMTQPPSVGIARWNGTTWSPMPSLGGVGTQVTVDASGDIHVSVFNSLTSSLRRWNGAGWSTAGSALLGEIRALELLPSGDFVAAGRLTTTGPTLDNIARWNGAVWTSFGAGTNAQIDALALLPDGAIAVGGRFASAGGGPAVGFTRLVSSCAPAAVSFGSGCSSSAGPVTLTATALPWIGSTFRATTTGVPANAIALAVSGFATASIPLASLLPQGVPGCLLLATPDLLDAYLPVAGSAASALTIPGSAALIGQTVHHQVVPVEFDAGGISALTSSNGLTLTIGSF